MTQREHRDRLRDLSRQLRQKSRLWGRAKGRRSMTIDYIEWLISPHLQSLQDFLCLNMVNWVLQLSQGMVR